MLDFLKEKTDCWDVLRRAEEPIFIYGMGDGAEKILKVFDMYRIPTAGFFASDEFVRGHSFKGHLVHSLSQIEKLVPDFIVVLAFGAGYESLYRRIEDIAARHTLYAPDVPVVGDGLFTYAYAVENAAKIRKVYDLLADDLSRKTFADVLNFRISGKIEYLTDCKCDEQELYSLLSLGDNEIYADLGAYNGDTVMSFIDTVGGRYEHIYAVEPDRVSFRKLCRTAEKNILADKITCINACAWDTEGEVEFSQAHGRNSSAQTTNARLMQKNNTVQTISVDSLPQIPTYIKADVEGAEMKVTGGMKKAVENGCKLNIALYHRTEDIFEIPLAIHRMDPSYKLYIRHKMYIPAWETQLIAVK